jgi:hypothetical protein
MPTGNTALFFAGALYIGYYKYLFARYFVVRVTTG